MPNQTVNIGNQIKRLRDSQNLSQDRFAKKIGLTGKTISAYETGRSTPPLKILQKIVSTYNASFINLPEVKKATLKEKIEILEREIGNLREILKEDFY